MPAFQGLAPLPVGHVFNNGGVSGTVSKVDPDSGLPPVLYFLISNGFCCHIEINVIHPLCAVASTQLIWKGLVILWQIVFLKSAYHGYKKCVFR
jgi:hypothetical protein